MSLDRSLPSTLTTVDSSQQEGFWHKVDRELDLLGAGFKAVPAAAQEAFTPEHRVETGLKLGLSVVLGGALAYASHSTAALPMVAKAFGIGVGVAYLGKELSPTGSALVDNWKSADHWKQNVQVMQHNFAPFAFDMSLNVVGSIAGGWAGQKLAASNFLSQTKSAFSQPTYRTALGAGTNDGVEPLPVNTPVRITAAAPETLAPSETVAQAATVLKAPGETGLAQPVAGASDLPAIQPYDVRNLGWKRFEELDWVRALKEKYPDVPRIATNASTHTGFDNVGETNALWEKAAAADRPFISEFFAGKLRLEELSCALSGAGAGLCDKRGAYLIINDLLKTRI